MTATDRYFDEMGRFQQEVSARNYKVALKHLRAGLRLTEQALADMHRESPGQPGVPFFEGSGAAIAALFNDQKCFALMDDLSKSQYVTRTPDVARFRRDAEVIDHVRQHLRRQSPIPLSVLKEGLTKDDLGRLSRLLDWMQKNNDLWVDKGPKDRLVSRGRPTPPRMKVGVFRAGMEPVDCPVLSLDSLPATYETDDDLLDNLEAETHTATALIERQPAEDRPPFQTRQTLVSFEGTWLMSAAREQANGRHAVVVERRDRDGAEMPSLTLPLRPLRVRSRSDRSYLSVLDYDLVLRTFDFDGHIMWERALLDSPDVQASIKANDETTTGPLRDIDVDLERAEVTFAHGDRFFWFNLDGELVAAGRLPESFEPPEPEDPKEVAFRESMRAGLIESGNLTPEMEAEYNDYFRGEWCYAVHLNDGHLYVSSYTGQTMKIAPGGAVLAAWKLPSDADRLWNVDGRLYAGFGGSWYGELIEGVPVTPRNAPPQAEQSERHLFGWDGREVAIADLASGETQHFAASSDVQAMWPAEGGFEVATKTTISSVTVPNG